MQAIQAVSEGIKSATRQNGTEYLLKFMASWKNAGMIAEMGIPSTGFATTMLYGGNRRRLRTRFSMHLPIYRLLTRKMFSIYMQAHQGLKRLYLQLLQDAGVAEDVLPPDVTVKDNTIRVEKERAWTDKWNGYYAKTRETTSNKVFLVNSNAKNVHVMVIQDGSNIRAFNSRCPHMAVFDKWELLHDKPALTFKCHAHNYDFKVGNGAGMIKELTVADKGDYWEIALDTSAAGGCGTCAVGGSQDIEDSVAIGDSGAIGARNKQVASPRSRYAKTAASLASKGKTVRIKNSSLNYVNARNRVEDGKAACSATDPYDRSCFYEDFNNEGHMYPFHGTGDDDKLPDLLTAVIKSHQGEEFGIKSDKITLKNKKSVPFLTADNAFFDFHTIPTRILDGSAKMPDGLRIEQWLKKGWAVLDESSGYARIKFDALSVDYQKNENVAKLKDRNIPTSHLAVRQSPYLKQDENLAIVMFNDGPFARINNGGYVNAWRYVVPTGYHADIGWGVFRAWKPAPAGATDAKEITTSNGAKVKVVKRTALDVENPQEFLQLQHEQNRYMELVSDVVIIKQAADKAAAFDQRFSGKRMDFGDLIFKPEPEVAAGLSKLLTKPNEATKMVIDAAKHYEVMVTARPMNKQKQFAFYEMINSIFTALKQRGVSVPGPYEKVETGTLVWNVWDTFKQTFLNDDTYNISHTALNTKAQLAKTYMPTSIGDTGWLVVTTGDELYVPQDDGEYYIGWFISCQPHNTDMVEPAYPQDVEFALNNGYVLHQGPGMIYMTAGDYAHGGAQEPYLLEHNYKYMENVPTNMPKEQAAFLHWRLDAPEVIMRSMKRGAFTETNVGAGQRTLLSIGTRTPNGISSKSTNYLGDVGKRVEGKYRSEFEIYKTYKDHPLYEHIRSDETAIADVVTLHSQIMAGGKKNVIEPFAINGKSASGPTNGQTGFFYPLYYTKGAAAKASNGTGAHVHTFEEAPGRQFYMPNNEMSHSMPSKPKQYQTLNFK